MPLLNMPLHVMLAQIDAISGISRGTCNARCSSWCKGASNTYASKACCSCKDHEHYGCLAGVSKMHFPVLSKLPAISTAVEAGALLVVLWVILEAAAKQVGAAMHGSTLGSRIW